MNKDSGHTEATGGHNVVYRSYRSFLRSTSTVCAFLLRAKTVLQPLSHHLGSIACLSHQKRSSSEPQPFISLWSDQIRGFQSGLWGFSTSVTIMSDSPPLLNPLYPVEILYSSRLTTSDGLGSSCVQQNVWWHFLMSVTVTFIPLTSLILKGPSYLLLGSLYIRTNWSSWKSNLWLVTSGISWKCLLENLILSFPISSPAVVETPAGLP